MSWADGGATCLANLVLLCRRHHRLLHAGAWRVVRHSDGVIDVLPTARAP
ncbi:MAG: HNH endonuclease [Actinomycetota bacterium]|nr:HNH endonuclease [Actinomycetota bacterium]